MTHPVGIIGAMEEEIILLKEQIKEIKEEIYFGFSFFSGTLNGTPVVLLKSGIGKVNAAVSTALLIEHFAPKYIINTGSAGGMDVSLNVGDVVISTQVYYHDVDTTAFGYAPGQMAGMPKAYPVDDFLYKAAKKHLQGLSDIQIVSGEIASGDVFMSDPMRVQHVKKTFPEVKAVEMEAAAIAQTCYLADVPFIIFRSLSDIAGKEGNNQTFESFVKIAGKHSAHMVTDLVRAL